MKVLDLCSGLGGFSSAFIDDPSWEVMRIENNPLLENVANTEIICIFEFRDNLADMIARGYCPTSPDLLLASPPCTEFSMGFHSPRSIASRAGTLDDYNPDMSILNCIIDIKNMLKPRFWIIENVVGARRYFEPIIGEQKQKNGSFCFYGKFPSFYPQGDIKKKSTNERWSDDPLRANYRALIPKNISSAIKQAIENQTTLYDYC